MRIDILDPDLAYAENLRRKISHHFPGVRIVLWTERSSYQMPDLDKLGRNNYLLIYTCDFYPDLSLPCRSLALRDEFPGPERPLGDEDVLRLGPLQPILQRIHKYVEESDLRTDSLKPLTSFLTYAWSEAEISYVSRFIDSLQGSATAGFILELGPSFYFSPFLREEKDKNVLLDLSLENIHAGNLGQYLEPWSYNPQAMRISLANHPDDWLLAPEKYLRQILYTFMDFAELTYGSDWRLFVISLMMPLRHNKLLASLSQEFFINQHMSPLGPLFDSYMDEISGLMPMGSYIHRADMPRIRQEEGTLYG